MNQNINIPMDDRDMMYDCLSAQKQISGIYDTYSNECATTPLRDEMLNILRDEHCIQADVFMEMQKRGWYPTPMAEDQKVQNAKQKFFNLAAQTTR